MTVFSAKFFKLLQTFSSEELKSFDAWLKSPWCNSNKNLITLLEKVKKYHPAFDYEKLTKEKLFRQVLPTGKYSDRRMNNLLSAGYQAAEKFIIHQNLQRNENLQKDLVTQEFQSRILEDWFFKEIKREIERLETKEVKDWEDRLDLMRMHRRKYHHPTSRERMLPGDRSLPQMSEQLDLIFLLEKAVIINEQILRHRIVKDENYSTEEELAKWEKVNVGISQIETGFYRKRFAYFKSQRVEDFLKLQEDFARDYKKFNLKNQKVFLITLINDGIDLFKAQKVDFSAVFPLYKIGLETEILLHNGILSFLNYVAIVTISNTLKNFAYTQYVINNYTSNLDEDKREELHKWAKAHTAYYKEELEEALDILLHLHAKNPLIEKFCRMLNIQVYFDLCLKDANYFDYLMNYLDSTEKWIRRGKINSNSNKNGYLRFVQLCRTLVKADIDNSLSSNNLSDLLTDEKNVQGVEWLSRKIEQILVRKSGGH